MNVEQIPYRNKGILARVHSEDHEAYEGTFAVDADQLSIYPYGTRLHPDTWAVLKEYNWVWCPKQERFRAKWSPLAEDLTLLLCGEIHEEELTLEDRALERAERFSDFSSNRRRDAEAAHKRADQISDRFAAGQPILIGHHSEGRARRDRDRMDQAMSRACSNWDRAERWQARAQASLCHAASRNDIGTRRNRIATLEAELRSIERGMAGREDDPDALRCHNHVRMRIGYERTILQAQLEELGQEDISYQVGGRIGGALILRVNIARASSEISSLTVVDPRAEVSGTHWRDTYQLKAKSLHRYHYVPPTEESLQELTAWQANAKSAKPAKPKLVNCQETCELLVRLWNAQQRQRLRANPYIRVKESRVLNRTQAEYSDCSGGTYSPFNTAFINQHGNQYCWMLDGRTTDHQKLFRIRLSRSTSDGGPCPIYISDRPQAVNPHIGLLRDLVDQVEKQEAAHE